MRSNAEWRYWGKADPLWAVAAWAGKDRAGPEPWQPDEFLRLGQSDFRDILHHWRHFGLTPGTCVEIGCGAGRMTGPLSLAFGRVVALDVSLGQLERARALLAGWSTGMVFSLVDRPVIPLRDGSCTGVFSCHVFQHFSAYTGVVNYLRESYRVLRGGSSICLHVPVPGAHQSSQRSAAWLAARNAKVGLARMLGKRNVMEYHRYAARTIFDTLAAEGFRDAELRIFSMASNGDAHSFFFASKP